MWDARQRRAPYENLPDELRPGSLVEAYAGQEAYYRLAEPLYGAVGGAKIATTTKVMQQLMGITHPCGGAIFTNTIHRSPARLRNADFVNLRLESEIALQLGPNAGVDVRHGRASPSRLRSRARCPRSSSSRTATPTILETRWSRSSSRIAGRRRRHRRSQSRSAGDLVGIAGRLRLTANKSAKERPRTLCDARLARQHPRRTRARPQSRHGGHHRQPDRNGFDLTRRCSCVQRRWARGLRDGCALRPHLRSARLHVRRAAGGRGAARGVGA